MTTTPTRRTRLRELAASEGFEVVADLLEATVTDSVSPGIRTTCGHTAAVEPDQDAGYCDGCGGNTVTSALTRALPSGPRRARLNRAGLPRPFDLGRAAGQIAARERTGVGGVWICRTSRGWRREKASAPSFEAVAHQIFTSIFMKKNFSYGNNKM